MRYIVECLQAVEEGSCALYWILESSHGYNDKSGRAWRVVDYFGKEVGIFDSPIAARDCRNYLNVTSR